MTQGKPDANLSHVMKNKPITLNMEQGLYVIPCGEGYSCLGFDVLEARYCKLASELVSQFNYDCPMPELRGTLERYAQYSALLEFARAKNTATGWRSKSELTPELIGFEGKRVEVKHADGVSRFIVGKSCGFVPCHLAISGRKSLGGFAVCLGHIFSVRAV